MGLAAGTLSLFLLLIPGMAFRSTYTLGSLTRKRIQSSAFDDFIYGIIPGILFQLIGILIVNHTHPFDRYIDLESFGRIIFNDSSGASAELRNIQNNIEYILLYNISLILSAAILGSTTRKIIRYLNLDHHTPLLRFSNEWFYILRGEVNFFRERQHSEDKRFLLVELISRLQLPKLRWKKVNHINLSFPVVEEGFYRRNKGMVCKVYAVVQSTEGKCFIYKGYIRRFYLAKDGSLDTVLLVKPQRKPFNEQTDDFFEIPDVDFVALRGKNIINFSVSAVSPILLNKAIGERTKLIPRSDPRYEVERSPDEE